LRNEFRQSADDIPYSYRLAQIIKNFKFERLLGEILSPKTIEAFYERLTAGELGYHFSDLLEAFLRNGGISKAEKEAVLMRMEKTAGNSSDEKALAFYEGLVSAGGYFARITPALNRNLERVENRLASKNFLEEESYKLHEARHKYLGLLFRVYRAQNDWQSAENLLLSKTPEDARYSLASIALTTAQTGAYADAVRLWKLLANLDRRNLNNLEAFAKYEQVKTALREFYLEMQRLEPHSPVPAQALEKLK
jgi:hypothetical protein